MFTMSSGLKKFLPAVVAGLLLGSGCADLGEEPEKVPRIEVAAGIHFGTVAVGDSSDTTLTVSSTGELPLVISGVNLTGTDTLDFRVEEGVEGTELPPGTDGLIVLTFVPVSEGVKSATLHILTNDPETPDAEVSLQGVGGEPVTTVSFSGDIQPIFTANCAVVGCHVAGHETGLDLREGQSYSLLVNVTSAGYAPALRVKPYDPDNSVLWNKVAGTGRYGDRMPLGGSPLAEKDTIAIRTWILEGALEN
ncbi:MAG: choice-of-anchor D domain-containing protein [Fidelibacterota bacterium]